MARIQELEGVIAQSELALKLASMMQKQKSENSVRSNLPKQQEHDDAFSALEQLEGLLPEAKLLQSSLQMHVKEDFEKRVEAEPVEQDFSVSKSKVCAGRAMLTLELLQ